MSGQHPVGTASAAWVVGGRWALIQMDLDVGATMEHNWLGGAGVASTRVLPHDPQDPHLPACPMRWMKLSWAQLGTWLGA